MGDETIKPLMEYLSKLKRAPAFEKDLYFYLGSEWKESATPTKAVQDYIHHLKQIEKEKPYLLIPYCFHLYFAMLAGGKMIKKMAIRTMNLPKNQGVGIFKFDDEVNQARLKNDFKKTINMIPLTVVQKEEIMKESVNVFRSNNKVVQSHEGTGPYVMKYLAVIVIGIVGILSFQYRKKTIL